MAENITRVSTQAGSEQSQRPHRVRRILLRTSISLLVFIVVLSIALGAGSYIVVQRTLPQMQGTVNVAGLQGHVSVVRDKWGVPHISAASLHDVAFAQGYVTAQDRLFQMEFNRRVAAGRLAEIFGAGSDNSLIDTDEFLRTLDLYGSAQRELAMLDPQTNGELQAYADGVNAFLKTHSNSLPLEFSILGVTPAPWTPLDSLAYGRVVALSLDDNWYTKYTRALVLAKVGPQVTNLLFPPYPASNPTLFTAMGHAAPLAPTGSGTPQISTPLVSGVSTVLLAHTHISSATRAAFAQLPLGVLRGAAMAHELIGNISDSLGSNDWVVDGNKTASGKPLLANDPHLGIGMPAIWYEVALRGGGLDAIGFSFPGVPGVVIGHNSYIAWGVTNVGADNTDLYLEKLDPTGHPGQYEYNRKWLPLETSKQVINVRGGSPVSFTVSFTNHGPLLNGVVSDLKHYTAVALQWTVLQPGYSFRGFFQLDFATNWQQFLAAVSNISISQNFVYADTSGHIGYRMSGELPLRSSDNDLLPVDGSTSLHDWHGYVPQNEMPMLFDPPTHVIATANNQIVPDDYATYVTATWDYGYRARRIIDLLSATRQLSIADYQRIQADVYAIPASQLAPAFVSAGNAGNAGNSDAASAAKLLRGWNYEMTRDSTAAAVYEVTVGNLLRQTLEPLLGKKLYGIYQSNVSSGTLFTALINEMANPATSFFGVTGAGASAKAARKARDTAIQKALATTMTQLRAQFGSDSAKWQWGVLHQAHFDHPLASVSPLNLIFGVSPVQRPGDGVTVSVGGDGGFSADPADYNQQTVSSMRQIIDLSNLEQSLWVTTTGESGQPFSAHYSDLIPLWDQNRYETMEYSPQAVAKAAANVLVLTP